MRKSQTTPRIQPQTEGKPRTCSFRIDRETDDRLRAYAEFISSDRSYVIREALRLFFSSDQTFQRHLRGHNLCKPEASASGIGASDGDKVKPIG